MTLNRQVRLASRWFAAAMLVCPLFAGDEVTPRQQTMVRIQPGHASEPTRIEAAALAGDRETLRSIVRDGSLADQEAAFNALHGLDPELAVEAAVTDFRNRSLGSRLQSLQLIDRSLVISNQTAVGVLREALHDADMLVSDFAIEALARRSEVDSRLLNSSDLPSLETQGQQLAKVRLAAIDHDASALNGFMRNGDGLVQAAAFEALAASDSAAAFAELSSELNDKNPARQLQTLELLVRNPATDRQFLGRVLEQASANPDPAVKKFASQALSRKNLEEAQPPSTQSELK